MPFEKDGCLHVKGECSMAMSKTTAKPTTKVQTKVEETKKAEVKAEDKPVEIKAEQMKLDVTTETKEVVEEKKETTTKKAAEKKTAEKKTAAKKTTEKKTTAKKETVKKEAAKASVHVQFNGKSYETEDFVNIAKDIWKYDLKKKAGDFKTVDIYVKPEENMAYYVINGEVDGSFMI